MWGFRWIWRHPAAEHSVGADNARQRWAWSSPYCTQWIEIQERHQDRDQGFNIISNWSVQMIIIIKGFITHL